MARARKTTMIILQEQEKQQCLSCKNKNPNNKQQQQHEGQHWHNNKSQQTTKQQQQQQQKLNKWMKKTNKKQTKASLSFSFLFLSFIFFFVCLSFFFYPFESLHMLCSYYVQSYVQLSLESFASAAVGNAFNSSWGCLLLQVGLHSLLLRCFQYFLKVFLVAAFEYPATRSSVDQLLSIWQTFSCPRLGPLSLSPAKLLTVVPPTPPNVVTAFLVVIVFVLAHLRVLCCIWLLLPAATVAEWKMPTFVMELQRNCFWSCLYSQQYSTVGREFVTSSLN